jgi:transcriptional regulator with XRE-family HTH domain
MKLNINSINEFCKLFRMNILKLSLQEVSEITGIKLSTLSSFENGRSNNLKYIHIYYSLGNEEQKEYFKNNLFE